MRIAFVVHDYHRGGGHSRYVAELATRFSQEHDVHVFANRVERSNEGHVIFHRVPALRNNVITTLFSFAISSKFAVGGGFDVVHSQGFCGPQSDVITTHICNRAWSRSLRRFTGGLTIRERVFDFFASNLERHMYRHARGSHVIAISKRVAKDVLECYGCPAPIHLIYHGVDLETFSPGVRRFRGGLRQSLGLSESDTVYLYVGDLRKGARQCIKALSQLDTGHLILVSRSAPEPYEAMATEAGVPNRVHLCGPTNHVEEYYGSADALLLPSPYDAFALVVTEAMACGLPVIVSREAGASELIDDGANGILLDDVNDEGALARQMRRIQNDSAWAGRLGQAGRITAERLSWDTVAKQTMRVYQEIVECRNGALSPGLQNVTKETDLTTS